MIDIYTSPGCPFCEMLKESLNKEKIEFNEKSVSEEKNEAEFKVYGIPAFPLTRIYSGDTISLVVGANIEKIKEFYALLKK